ncbi:MAG: PQQ-dependent sugar dehydrogenase [Planctomycetota bacterium]|jgi:glucose/arabinose dehydrogenase
MRRPRLGAAELFGAAALLLPGLGKRCEARHFPKTTPPPKELAHVELTLFAKGLDKPLHLIAAPGDPEHVYVVEKAGRIWVYDLAGERQPWPFLDIKTRVRSRASEQGLLSLAFHPGYAKNGRFFLNYTDHDNATRVVELRRDAKKPLRADPTTERLLVEVSQPFRNHNGGHILFGPDGYLYIGMGDGGAANDPFGHGRKKKTRLGTLLRIDVDSGDPYGIPKDNPFADGKNGLPEVYAYGLRNPWRMAFDFETGAFYAADVGQNKWEEVNAVAKPTPGLDYGWNHTEGRHAFRRDPDWKNVVEPVAEFDHREGLSITGGHVYRGKALPKLRGHYFYADYVTCLIRSFRFEDGVAKDPIDWTDLINPGKTRVTAISSFGEDGHGELYVISLNGKIFRLSPVVR